MIIFFRQTFHTFIGITRFHDFQWCLSIHPDLFCFLRSGSHSHHKHMCHGTADLPFPEGRTPSPSAGFSHHMYTKSADHCHKALPSAYRFYHTGTVHGCHLRHILLQVFLRKSMYYLPLFKHILLFLNEIYYLFCKYSNSFLNHSQFALYNLS